MTQTRLCRRLRRVENAACQTAGLIPVVEHAPAAGDVGALASEMATAFAGMIECYRDAYQLSTQDAVARATELPPEAERQRLLTCPPGSVTWHDLEALSRSYPEGALQRWEEVKHAALEERRSGHPAARALEGQVVRAGGGRSSSPCVRN